MKHTPGPWYYEDDSYAPYIVDSTRVIRLADVHDTPFLSNGNCGRRASKANARLIAAAPELLESLREMLPIVHDAMNADDDDVIGKIAYRASAAIAKAEGR